MTNGTMYDSTQPGAIPEDATVVALYRNGRFAATQAQASAFPVHLWIDVLATAPAEASILDVETGDATPADVPRWVSSRLADSPLFKARLYCDLSTWPAVRAEVATLPPVERAQVRYWIANPTGTPHLVPGSDATQYLWTPGFDVSEFGSNWLSVT